ncbi:unnamed protein product (macronuclear) [Paramecium tetraurelia]|uniref:Uncharacterized protein n=1 Tax=Paramecium tetraurelia TaxID=5888 RepID=A0D7Q7_PARTE|nr:uncharacterized protein GSPATT00014041001 [Paramecium tetraurelia]CAK79074.1 unnamed protein product [Paramecium tetraurelia]|eukprot:XP_001446471.1 hypothetical protein (macronuclear) [Paramecium tetraurelia strain d4-2]
MNKFIQDKIYQSSQHEEITSLIYKITDRQTKFAELHNQVEESIQKVINVSQKQFEKVMKRKQKEFRQILQDHDERIKEITQKYHTSQNNQIQYQNQKKSEYIRIFESLYYEYQQFIAFFDHDQQAENSNYIIMIYEILTESQVFHEDQRLNETLLNEYLKQHKMNKILSLHASLKLIIPQLQKVEENLQLSKINSKKGQYLNILNERLKAFIENLKYGLNQLDMFLSQIQENNQVQKELDTRIHSNLILINQLLKNHQDRKMTEYEDLNKTNENLIKIINRLLDINYKLKLQQKQNYEDVQQLMELYYLQNDKAPSLQPLSRKSTIKIIKPISYQRTRIFSETKKEVHFDLSSRNSVKEMNLESQILYQSPLIIQPQIVNQPTITDVSLFNSGQSLNKIKTQKYCDKHWTSKHQTNVDKKTAIPIKCQCPPQCSCQALLIIHVHTCNKQLYVNSIGQLLCQQCLFTQNIQDYSFYCPHTRTKNKFKCSKDFLEAFWQHIKTLTMNQQIVDFWNRLQISCQQMFQANPFSTLEIQNSMNFIAFCPNQCKCNHKQSRQKYHLCESQLQITSDGLVHCKKCNFNGDPKQYICYCPDTKTFNIYRSGEEFVQSLDLILEVGNQQQQQQLQNQFIQQLRQKIPFILWE